MTFAFRRTVCLPSVLIAVLSLGGCGGEQEQVNSTAGGPPPPPGGGRSNSEIKQIMVKLAKGPTSLTPMIGNELAADPPPWETIQPQTKEFAKLAADLGKLEPSKGSKESWASLTAAYSKSADDLDKAAQAKDRGAATTAHDILSKSCKSCHDVHRGGGPGMGGPGGPGMGPGYPGPGGPGGPPPK